MYISPTGPGRTLRRWAGCSGCRPCCTAGGTQGTGIGRLPRAFCSKSRRSGVCAHTHRHARERPRLLGENRLKAAEGEGSARTWYPHGHGRKERSSSSIPSRHSGHASIGSSGSAMVGGARAWRSVGPECTPTRRISERQHQNGERGAKRGNERRGQGRSRNATANRSYDRVPTDVLAVQLCSLLFYALLLLLHIFCTCQDVSSFLAILGCTLPMLLLCLSYASHMLSLCSSYDRPTRHSCPSVNIVTVNTLPMLLLWFPMLLLCSSYAPPMPLLCSSYAFPMLLLCSSHGFPMFLGLR